jgi:endonuclease/exonuclease/phosphatase family metal-dependent hydrolase
LKDNALFTLLTPVFGESGPFLRHCPLKVLSGETKHMLLFVVLLLLQIAVAPARVSDQKADSLLLESGKAATLRKHHANTAEIKIVSYNIRWRGGDELKKLAKLLHEDPEIGGAAILGLQEVDRHKKRTGRTNTVKALADELGMHYAWAAPPAAKPDDEEETGVAILSPYPLSDLRRIVLPHPGPNRRRRVALGATVELEGRPWRAYSAHAETRISVDKKMGQFNAILEDLARYPADMPAVVMGDLNTWQGDADDKTIKLFSDAGLKTPFGSQSTFRRRVLLVPIQFRLDWVWLRGLEATGFGIDREIEISDHWPLWTKVTPPAKPAATKK